VVEDVLRVGLAVRGDAADGHGGAVAEDELEDVLEVDGRVAEGAEPEHADFGALCVAQCF